MVRATRFTDPASVDVWDQWFRWRDAECLHDRTIDATWARVANAIVPAGDPDAARWAERYVDVFSRWQLLPDERVLRNAGTVSLAGSLESPVAVLNVAAFVIAPRSRQARFDDERFTEVAALSVRMLDDALIATQGATSRCSSLRIGLLGFADALHLLGMDYDDPRAPECANMLGAVLHAGVLQGEMELIDARGAWEVPPDSVIAKWRDRRVPEQIIENAAARRIRHRGLTAITPQPRLALLANHASDALDPHSWSAPDPFGRTMNNPGCACHRMDAKRRAAARHAIHTAIQPWIDMPIASTEP